MTSNIVRTASLAATSSWSALCSTHRLSHKLALRCQPQRLAATSWIRDSQWLHATSPKVIGPAERQAFVGRIESLRSAILNANWGDTFQFVLNAPFWEAIFEELHGKVRSMPNLLHDADVGRNWVAMSTLMDFMFICEDLRDHLNEILEFLDRTNSRDAGCSQQVSNLDEHIKVIADRYEVLKSKFPKFENKLDESVGKGLRLLRQRYRFEWEGQHAAYY